MGNENLVRLMQSAWPDGIPREEAAIAAGLDDDRATIAYDRLKALLAYESGDGHWTRRSREADLDRATFFALAGEWRATRSLASIVPHVRAYRTARRRREDLESLVREAIAAEPDGARRRLAELVRERMVKPAGLTTIEASVDAVRVDLERERLGGAEGFGRLVVVDTCPAQMRVGDPSEDADYAVAWGGFVVDVASGSVIASSAAGGHSEALRLACLRAAIRVEPMKADAAAAPMIEVHIRGDAVSKLRETARLTALGADVHAATGQRSESSRVTALIGRRFGPVTLKLRLDVPEPSQTTERNGMPDAEMIDARIEAETRRLWERSSDEPPMPAVSPKKLARMLRAVGGDADDEG